VELFTVGALDAKTGEKATPASCPVDKVQKYTAAGAADGAPVALAAFTAAAPAPGASTHLFKVGDGKAWSDMLTLTLVVCGEETIAASGPPRALNFVYTQGA